MPKNLDGRWLKNTYYICSMRFAYSFTLELNVICLLFPDKHTIFWLLPTWIPNIIDDKTQNKFLITWLSMTTMIYLLFNCEYIVKNDNQISNRVLYFRRYHTDMGWVVSILARWSSSVESPFRTVLGNLANSGMPFLDMGSNLIMSKPLFLWSRNFTFIAQYWLVSGTDSRVSIRLLNLSAPSN